ncbi:ABC transporter permease [Streptomyces physcomitrii]|uniref:Ribose/xylose/arabinose/galactoside ABC transporter permease protein n=1 Tax=Streptomyces albus (strain ATCC 21838 / DSM 41398 / FERM P-419 / JCM 4703 / NBRC 107858) TaxID=1081613 RepID=A0A0B5EIW4_STRA4|nr:ABC transporter permease [Streptomyces sp. SCSIO ZS0520]AJE81419.1 ribose/xylose/arabinose/galactoside ABC transporter permease protein [Streptomyces albus]AOU75735.1 ribose/xylose/arabinose/galactoside ABC transporter permease protein [Streptomyces albus]AYN31538.1 ABC transporter permease [Streptomyces albus]UFZ14056.1 ABC transporter [Streptomyces sp.]
MTTADIGSPVRKEAPPGAEPLGATRAERLSALAQQHGALVTLVIAVIAASLSFDTFLTGDNLQNMALSSAFLAVVALGMTFVIVTGGIDLSVGSLFALGGVLAAWGSQYGTLVALLLPLAVCGLIGVVNGLLIARSGLAPFIVTLAAMLGARGILLAVTDEGSTTYLVDKDTVFASLGQETLLGLGVPVWITLALFGLGALVLRRTRFGQYVYAVGGNEDAAALMGAPVARTKIAVYTVSGLCAGLAGALNAAWLVSGVTILGSGMELEAISAVVIGGTLLSGGFGFISGSLVGVLLLKVIQNVINQIGSLDSAYQQVVSGAFLAVVVVAQTWLGRRQRVL